ncbi:MAG TPA: gluconate 2-dehydrogenase subunit 3 family protein [Longimicrobiales bacterium]|nr:gluconate 2-dehydrogenase subunit 3 family protein [Longimicrobiales bacterium]
MLPGSTSRRDFLRASGLLAVGGGMALSLTGCREAADSAADALRTGEGPRVLTDAERRTLEAFSDRILPPDGDAPGAAALGAVAFMDHYAARKADILEGIRHGLEILDARVRAAHPGAGSFADLDGDAMDAIVGELEKDAPDAFWPLQTMVVVGAFAAPAHGGNTDKAGWALVGYDDRHMWQPPFGFYDAEATRAGDR